MRRTWYGILSVGIGAALLLTACDGDESGADATSTTAPSTATAAATEAATGTAAATEAAPEAGFDTAFGEDGILTVALSDSENDRFMAAAAAPDGGFFAAGFVVQSGDAAMAVAKFGADGTLDAAYGAGGVAVVNVASGGKTAEIARSIAVADDGSVVIAGVAEHDTTATGDAARDTDIFVVRLDPSGAPDASFGTDGIARVDVGTGRPTSDTAFTGDNGWGVGLLSDGSVVVFGSELAPAGGDRTDNDFVVVGLTSDGQLNDGFGTGGFIRIDREGVDNPRHVTVVSDDEIIATGYSNVDGVVQPVLLRFNSAGELDASFGTDGLATAAVLAGVAESYAVGIQDGYYVTAGYGRGADDTEKVDMVIKRWSSTDGAWDKSFGTDGVVRLDLASEDDRSRNVTVLPDNRILAVGSGKLDADNVDALVYLLNEDGTPAAFGDEGHILTDLGGPADAWYGVAVLNDGSVIVVGYKGVAADSGQNDDAVIGRILP